MNASSRAVGRQEDLPLGGRESTIRAGENRKDLPGCSINIKAESTATPHGVAEHGKGGGSACGNQVELSCRCAISIRYISSIGTDDSFIKINGGVIGGVRLECAGRYGY